MAPNNTSQLKLPRRNRRKKSARAIPQMMLQPISLAIDRQPAVKAGECPATSKQWRITPAGNRSPLYLAAKRIFDILGAIAILTILAPILLIVAAILLVTTRGRPIFVQERVGFLGHPFRLYKFRTMVLNAEKLRDMVVNQKDGPIFKNDQDPRITRFGRLLRRTSMDELPQLFNILRGDMSLIGPRPPLAKEVAEYEPWHCKRLSVKPGLTCLWQISGRSEIAFHRWMLMDLWYVKHQCLWTDFKLLLATPWAVLSRRGAY